MRTFLTEIQNRPDGLANNTINSYSSAAAGLAQWYQRASVAVTTKNFRFLNISVLCAHFLQK